ncbi:flagellar brake protein [Pseudalkalibacillus decolorationis]|uniref:flagellar brake protein n=1 Tax=Pseudalkalibacillus decolorationis TaxID=163879 RepID=UPI0021485CB4|nr:PilZ domain-containing protein [Pseudalkalibacillus decolorationis]
MLSIGETLFLDIQQGKELTQYKCKVEQVTNDHIYITYPTNLHTNKTEFFKVGTFFEAQYTTKEKETYAFRTELIDRLKEHIPLLKISLPQSDQIEKIQRRAYVRVDSSIDVAVHSVSDKFQPFKALTSDISAGGCAIILPENHPLQENSDVECWIVLPIKTEYQYLRQKAKVIRILEGNNGERNKATLHFIDVTEEDRRSILRFCFEEQLLLKKKGLL